MPAKVSRRLVYLWVFMIFCGLLAASADAAGLEPEINGIAKRGDSLYLATSFTNQFILERGNAAGQWEPVEPFTDLSAAESAWFRAVMVDQQPEVVDEAVVFTPGEVADGKDAPPAADGAWTLIHQVGPDGAGVYGPWLRTEAAASAVMGDEMPAAPVSGPAVIWISTNGGSAWWQLNSNGVRTANGIINTSNMPPASWIFGGAADINNDGRPELFWCPTNQVMKTWFLDENLQYSSNVTMYGSECPKDYQYRASGPTRDDGINNLYYQDIDFGYIDSWVMNPDGTLRVANPTYATSIERSWQLRCAGDVSGDGRVELFFHKTNGQSGVWFMDTNGFSIAYRAVCPTRTPSGWELRGCGDVSGDGRVELFWQRTNGATAVWFMDTNGAFVTGRAITSVAVPNGWTLRQVLDVNNDGRVELLWQNVSGATAIWFMNTNGVKTSSRLMNATAISPEWIMRGAHVLPPITAEDGGFDPLPAADDMPAVPGNVPTVIWIATNGASAWWQLNTGGVRTANGIINTSNMPPDSWIFGGAADINNDGRPELFWCPTNQVMKTWFLDENLQYSSNVTMYGSECPKDYQYRASGPTRDDGINNLYYQDIDFGYIDSWVMNPDGTLRVANPTYATSIERSWQLRCAGDVSGDGRVELFFQNTNTGASQVWFMDTNGQQTAMLPITASPIPSGWTLRGAGDCSGDGRVELFWQRTNGQTAVWFMNTNGAWVTGRSIYSGLMPSGWTLRQVLDVNGDGRVELLWQRTNGQTGIWFLDTNGVRTAGWAMNANISPMWIMRGASISPPNAPPY